MLLRENTTVAQELVSKWSVSLKMNLFSWKKESFAHYLRTSARSACLDSFESCFHFLDSSQSYIDTSEPREADLKAVSRWELSSQQTRAKVSVTSSEAAEALHSEKLSYVWVSNNRIVNINV